MKTLDTIVNTAKQAVSAANPLHDAKQVVQSAKNLASKKPSFSAYKDQLKQGKFLGEGNVAKLLYYSGIVLTNNYLPLVALRGTIGAGAYLTKEALQNETVKNIVSSIAQKSAPLAGAAAKSLGVPYKKMADALKKENVKQKIENLQDPNVYKKSFLPAATDVSIGALGWGSLVGAKYLFKGGAKVAEGVKDYSALPTFRHAGDIGEKVATVASNVANDLLSASLFGFGVHNYTDADIHKIDEIPQKVKKFENDVRNAPEQIRHYLHNDLDRDVQSGIDKAKIFVQDKIEDTRYAVDDIKENTRELQQAYRDGTLDDAIKDSLLHKAKEVGYDLAFLTGLDNSEKYAVLVTGYNDSSNLFIAHEHARVYNDLVNAGFKPENIYVHTPNATIPYKVLQTDYGASLASARLHDSSVSSLERTYADLSKKIDPNDVFVNYITAHGNHSGGSYVGLENGKQHLADQRLNELVEPIKAGKELHVVEACHSGGFARELDADNAVVVSSSRESQPAWGGHDGLAFGSYLSQNLDELEYKTPKSKIIEWAKDAMQKHRDTNYAAERHYQRPVIAA